MMGENENDILMRPQGLYSIIVKIVKEIAHPPNLR